MGGKTRALSSFGVRFRGRMKETSFILEPLFGHENVSDWKNRYR
jgi:hypothetical protein